MLPITAPILPNMEPIDRPTPLKNNKILQMLNISNFFWVSDLKNETY